jgi:hypothetical protein
LKHYISSICIEKLLRLEQQLFENIKNLFFDPALAMQYYLDGYLVIPDFLNDAGLNKLRTLHTRHLPVQNMEGKGIYSNLEENPMDTNKDIEQTIYDSFSESMNAAFHNYQIYGGSFLVKGWGDHTQTDIHQDWCAVDEKKFPAFSVWVPLQDVDETSGCLAVVPGSHLWADTVRGVNFPSVYIPLQGEAGKYVTRLPVKAGTAVVFSMNLFHGSFPNLQGFQRPAMHLVLTSAGADIIHYFHQARQDKFAVVDCNKNLLYDFIFDMQSGVLPAAAKVLDTVDNASQKRLTEEEWMKLAAEHLNVQQDKGKLAA